MFNREKQQGMTISGSCVEISTFQRGVRRLSPYGKSVDDTFYLKHSVARAKRALTRLVYANSLAYRDDFGNPIPARFVTLTFENDIRDLSVANYEYKKFIERLGSAVGSRVRWLAVPELQNKTRDGVVHYHQLIFNLPYRDEVKKFFSERWGNGFLKFETMRSARGASWYVSKYMLKGFENRKKGSRRYYHSELKYPVVERDEIQIELARQRLTYLALTSEIVSAERVSHPSAWVDVYEKFILPTGWTWRDERLTRII